MDTGMENHDLLRLLWHPFDDVRGVAGMLLVFLEGARATVCIHCYGSRTCKTGRSSARWKARCLLKVPAIRRQRTSPLILTFLPFFQAGLARPCDLNARQPPIYGQAHLPLFQILFLLFLLPAIPSTPPSIHAHCNHQQYPSNPIKLTF